MDCCNYVPYRPHQPYYGYYNEPLPPYHGEFYGHHNMYHDYYRNVGPYYSPQHWQGGDVFAPPDYVYNPKEARIRKAMREASRDRSIGGSPMLPRPNARRPPPHGWVPPGAAHEELMMTPLPAGMSGSSGLDAPCFPMPSSSGTGTNQFMPTMNSGYSTKLHQDAPLPPPTTDPSVHSNYMQPNPLSQLQQQTEMWHNFQDDLRPRSSGNPYMMQDIPPSPYHHQPSPPLSVPSPLMMDKHRQTPHPIHSMSNTSMPITPPHSNSNMSMTPPHSNENIPPDESTQISVGKMFAEDGCLETRPVTELPHPLMENNVQQHPEFMPMYGQEGAAAAQQQYSQQQQHQQPQQRQFNHQQQSHSQRQPRQQRQNFDRVEEMQMKRIPDQTAQNQPSSKNVLYLPLSCTKFCASPDLFTNNLEYQREYIVKYFQTSTEYEMLHLTSEDGSSFPYATAFNCPEVNYVLEDCPQPNFIQTDVGFIPVVLDDNNRSMK
ncbi:uncharacterized protein isoform X3 [Leptinotarsa decemlineata]|uniref:uncharacterized protein isoform X3 n=1 Tax=Leptinotarsa decemlineata TaxID=7539 RepID=UPI003D30712A